MFAIIPGNDATIEAPQALSRAGTSHELAAQTQASKTQVMLVTVGILPVTFTDGSTGQTSRQSRSRTSTLSQASLADSMRVGSRRHVANAPCPSQESGLWPS